MDRIWVEYAPLSTSSSTASAGRRFGTEGRSCLAGSGARRHFSDQPPGTVPVTSIGTGTIACVWPGRNSRFRYDVDVDAARGVIRKSIESLDVVSDDKPVDVFAKEFNSSSVDFNVRWWSHSKSRDMHESRDEVIAAIEGALDDAGMEIPFPYQHAHPQGECAVFRSGFHQFLAVGYAEAVRLGPIVR